MSDPPTRRTRMLVCGGAAIAGLLALQATTMAAEVWAQTASPQRSASSVVAAATSPVPALSPAQTVVAASNSHMQPTVPAATAVSNTRHVPAPASSSCAAYGAAAAGSSRAAYAESRFARSCLDESPPAAATAIPDHAATASPATPSASAAAQEHQAPAVSSIVAMTAPAPAAATITSYGANASEPSDAPQLSDADPGQVDEPNTFDGRFAGRTVRKQQQASQAAAQDPAADDRQPSAQPQVVASSTSNGVDSPFADRSLLSQQEPPQATPAPLPTPEVAGVNARGARPDRASVGLEILPPTDQGIPSTVAMIPSTGSPSAAVLAVGLVLLGGVGLWLRRLGAQRT